MISVNSGSEIKSLVEASYFTCREVLNGYASFERVIDEYRKEYFRRYPEPQEYQYSKGRYLKVDADPQGERSKYEMYMFQQDSQEL